MAIFYSLHKLNMCRRNYKRGKLFIQGGNYSREETISENTVNKGQCMGLEDYDFTTI